MTWSRLSKKHQTMAHYRCRNGHALLRKQDGNDMTAFESLVSVEQRQVRSFREKWTVDWQQREAVPAVLGHAVTDCSPGSLGS